MTISAARYFHPSNLVTYVSLLAGLFAIVSAKEFGRLSATGGLIALCALADTLDGKFAQLFERTESQKQFGVQLDSLTDSLTFGLAPVVSFYIVVPFESLTARLIWGMLVGDILKESMPSPIRMVARVGSLAISPQTLTLMLTSCAALTVRRIRRSTAGCPGS